MFNHHKHCNFIKRKSHLPFSNSIISQFREHELTEKKNKYRNLNSTNLLNEFTKHQKLGSRFLVKCFERSKSSFSFEIENPNLHMKSNMDSLLDEKGFFLRLKDLNIAAGL